MEDQLKTIIAYCKNETCGDPVIGVGRPISYTKRLMQFNGFEGILKIRRIAVYICPVCGETRKFREKLVNKGWNEIYK